MDLILKSVRRQSNPREKDLKKALKSTGFQKSTSGSDAIAKKATGLLLALSLVLRGFDIKPTICNTVLMNVCSVDRVIYARKGGEEGVLSATNLGGEKISVEDACVSSLSIFCFHNFHYFFRN